LLYIQLQSSVFSPSLSPSARKRRDFYSIFLGLHIHIT
jgi:hypothetical protein